MQFIFCIKRYLLKLQGIFFPNYHPFFGSTINQLIWSPSPFAAAAAKSLQSCRTLFDPIDGSPPGFPVPGILQARTLERVAISFSNEWKWKVKVESLSHVWLFATPWTAAHQAPPSMGFFRQEYWSRVPFPSPSPFAIITIIFHGFKPLIFLSFAFLRNYQTSAVGLVLDPVGISNRILIFSGHWAPFVVYSSEMVLFLSW